MWVSTNLVIGLTLGSETVTARFCEQVDSRLRAANAESYLDLDFAIQNARKQFDDKCKPFFGSPYSPFTEEDSIFVVDIPGLLEDDEKRFMADQMCFTE